jgi:hypothetical protein
MFSMNHGPVSEKIDGGHPVEGMAMLLISHSIENCGESQGRLRNEASRFRSPSVAAWGLLKYFYDRNVFFVKKNIKDEPCVPDPLLVSHLTAEPDITIMRFFLYGSASSRLSLNFPGNPVVKCCSTALKALHS